MHSLADVVRSGRSYLGKTASPSTRGVIDAVTAAVALGFWRSPLGRAERYLSGGDLAQIADQEPAVP